MQPTQQNGSRRRYGHTSAEERWANGLGWFSIGLGAAEVIAPRAMGRLIGVNGGKSPRVLRAYGLREIAAGIGILSQPKPVGWLWSRVAGDIVDLASLGSAARSKGANRARIAAASTAVLGVTALDVLCTRELSRTASSDNGGRTRITRSIIIDRSPREVWDYWHNLEDLRTALDGIASIQVLGDGRSHWKLQGPMGKSVEWNAETVIDEPGSHVAWRSLEGSDIDVSGSVWFEKAPGDRGTLVRVQIEYGSSVAALAGKAGKLVGAGEGDPVERVLRRVKQILETGEIVRSDASVYRRPHAAQPSR